MSTHRRAARWVTVGWALAMLLAGCGADEYDDDDDTTAGDDDDSTPTGNVTITAVSPSSGAPEGGYPADVYGTYFTTAVDTQIFFGDRAATIQECADNRCTVTVPAAEEEGEVDVTVVNSIGEGELEDGFTYTLDMDELTTYFVELVRVEYAYPDVYTPPPSPEVWARGYTFEPTELNIPRQVLWGNQLPTMGNCVMFDKNTDWAEPDWDLVHAGSEITLSGPSTYILDRYWGYYKLDDAPIEDWVSGMFTLDIPGGDDLPPDVITEALYTPPAFTTYPAMDPGEMSLSTFNMGVTVSIQGECDSSVVALDVYYTGNPYLIYEETILCLFPGVGEHTVPGAFTSLFPGTAGVITHIECFNEILTEAGSGAIASGVGRAIISGVILIQ